MNIWIFNHYAIPPSLPGGTRHFDIGRELVKRKHQVTIFSSSFHHYLQQETIEEPGRGWRIEEVEGVKFVWVKTIKYSGNDWRRVLNMVSYFINAQSLARRLTADQMRLLQPPQVVIGSSVHLLAALAAYRLARKFRAKFIMEVRDLWPQTIIEMGELKPGSPVTRLLQALERFLYRKADKIVTLLPKANIYIESLGISAKKIFWIPNGADLSRFTPAGQCRPKGAEFRVIYLGAHGQANALGPLLEAAEILQRQGHSQIKILLVGEGAEKPRLAEFAKNAQLKNVEFRDPVQKEAVPGLLSAADAAVLVLHDLPIYKYGISLNKIFDYMAMGLPVVLAGRPAADPVAEAGCGLSVPPDDPQALAAGLLEISRLSADELRQMGLRGRSYVEANHSIKILGDQWERVLGA